MKQIYVIKNIVNDKVYVGQADNAYDRFRRHRNNHVSSDKQNLKIVNAMKELGKDNFYFVILENCSDELADEREMYYISKFDSVKNGYNKTYGGKGSSTLGQEDIEECCRLFELGYTIKDIEGTTGINHKFIKRELSKIYPNYAEITKENTNKARNESKSKPVIQYDINGNFIKRYSSANEAYRELGKATGTSSIGDVCKHLNGRQTAYGYKWEYETQGENKCIYQD